jgi:N-methylhydantoinase B
MNDGIFGEIIRQYFETLAAEMNTVLDRTALSPIFNEAHDCSAGIFSFDGAKPSLIARANAEPVHIFASLESVRGVLDYFRNDLHEGDVIIVNDPYAFGTHSADWTVVQPVFFEGQPIFFPGVRGHIIEHGSPLPGGISPFQFDIWQESIRFMPLKLYQRGELQADVLGWLRANNRQADVMNGDLQAMIGACRVAAKRIREVVSKYGLARVQYGVDYILDYSERRVRAAIAELPDGKYFGRKLCDTDYCGHLDLNIDCNLEVKGDELIVDFTGTSPQGTGHVNSTPGSTGSWVYCALSAIYPEIPVNSGFFRPVKIIMPEGTLVNATSPAPVATNTVNIGSSIGDAVMKAFEHVVPELVGSIACDLTITVHLGQDQRFEEKPFFVNVDYLMSAVSASGAYGVDGWGGWSPTHCSHRMPTVEMTEVATPVFYKRAEYEIDTAAPGQWRGVPAFVVERQNPSDQYVAWMICVQSYRHTLPGWVGGKEGAKSFITLDLNGEREQLVTDYAYHYVAQPNEVIFAQSGGGGGWGNPFERDPKAVLEDVRDEYITRKTADEDYGVVFSKDKALRLDEAATRQRRAELQASAH